MNRWILAAALVVTFSPKAALAHEGESHAEPKIQAVTLPTEGLIAESAVTESVELVIKHPPLTPGRESEWTLYLSDYETNQPIENASITVSIEGQADSEVAANATSVSGVYAANLIFKEGGIKTLNIKVSSEELFDILSISNIQFGGEEGPSPANNFPWRMVLSIALFGAVLSAAFLFWKKRKSLKLPSLLIVMMFLPGSFIHAHGGESHGEDGFEAGAEAVFSGQSIHLSKESQFLLGVRTVLVERKLLKKRIKTLGKVVPRRQGVADVYPPQSGRIVAHGIHYKVPRIGDRVKKGQIVAEIQTISSFHVKAPISGVVTELNFTIGEQVDTSRKLLTILDPKVLWVEAHIFEPDLRAVEDAREALITSSIYSEKSFRGKLVALSAVFDEATRSVKAIFEFVNRQEKLRPGMFVDVEIEAREKEETLAVPTSAVLDKNGTRVVFFHAAPEEFIMREIQTGGVYGDYVAVRSGVKEGERVVTVGAYQLLTAPASSRK